MVAPPLFLFSTSNVADLAAAPAEVRAQFDHIRGRRETAEVRAVSIANFAGAVHAATIRVELDGRTIVFERTLQDRINDGKDTQHFWEGTSVSRDELDLLFWRGRLSGRLRTEGNSYKLERLQGPLHALVLLERLKIASDGCDIEESTKAAKGDEYGFSNYTNEVVAAKSSSAQQYVRVLALYTDDALDAFGLLENLEDAAAWGIHDMKTAFSKTAAYTEPKLVGTERTSYDEPASWTNSSAIWTSVPDAEFNALRDPYQADVIMLIVDGLTTKRGGVRTIFPTDLSDAIFYVVSPFLDNPPFFTPAHEMGHIFGALHGNGFELKDINNKKFFNVCYHFTPFPSYRLRNRTIMVLFAGDHEGRVNYYSAINESIQLYCPDESGYHTFYLGDFGQDVETDFIEMYEDHVSNLFEDNSEAAARVAEVAPAPLGDAGIEGSTGVFSAENYPNPFNPQTTLRFTLPEEAHVRLTVYDVLGREIMVLVDGPHRVGTHEAHFDGSRLPSGIYVYRLRATGEHGTHEATGRLTMLK